MTTAFPDHPSKCMTDHILEVGGTLTVIAGEHHITIARGGRGEGLGVMDERGAWLPPLGDDEPTRNVFEVEEWHPAFSDDGAGEDHIADAIDGTDPDTTDGTARELMEYAMELSRLHPLFPSLLLLKARLPRCGIRDVAQRLCRNKSQTAALLRELAKARPNLKPIAEAGTYNVIKAQRRRRRRERGADAS